MEFSEILANLQEKRKKQGVLIAAHRGTFGGAVVQNTLLSYKNALLHGADIVEVDVAKSADGVLYAHHFGTEAQVFAQQIDIRTMNSEEIDRLNSVNAIGVQNACSLERLDHVLEELKGKCYINIDHAWFNWEAVIRTLMRHNMRDQIILKSHVDDALSAAYKELGGDMMYMPILKNGRNYIEEFQKVERFDLPIAAAEVLIMDSQALECVPELIAYLHDGGYLAWVNTLTMTEKIPAAFAERIPADLKDSPEMRGMLEMMKRSMRGSFCFGLDDNTAIAEGPERVYGTLMKLGFDVIQTDWPALVYNYVHGLCR